MLVEPFPNGLRWTVECHMVWVWVQSCFFICINDLSKCKESYLNVFVDDAKHHERSEKRGWLHQLTIGRKKTTKLLWNVVDEIQLSMCKLIRMGQSKIWPQYDYYLSGNKLKDSMCKKGLGINLITNLLPWTHIRRIVKGTNCLLANIRITF